MAYKVLLLQITALQVQLHAVLWNRHGLKGTSWSAKDITSQQIWNLAIRFRARRGDWEVATSPQCFSAHDVHAWRRCLQLLPHRNYAYEVRNRVRDCTFAIFIRINAGVPSIIFVLGAKNHGTSDTSCFIDFLKSIGI